MAQISKRPGTVVTKVSQKSAPVAKKPAQSANVVSKKSVAVASSNKRPAQQPVAKQPVAKQPVAKQPVGKQPVAKQPVGKQPVGNTKAAAAKKLIKKPAANVNDDWGASAARAGSGFPRLKLSAGSSGKPGSNWCRIIDTKFGECWAHFVKMEDGMTRRYNCPAPLDRHSSSEDFCPFCYAAKVNGDESFAKEFKHLWAINVLPGEVTKIQVQDKHTGKPVIKQKVVLNPVPILLEVGAKTFKQLAAYHNVGEWPSITTFNIDIQRVGTGQMDTTYTVVPSRSTSPAPELEGELIDLAAVCEPGNVAEMCELTGLDPNLFDSSDDVNATGLDDDGDGPVTEDEEALGEEDEEALGEEDEEALGEEDEEALAEEDEETLAEEDEEALDEEFDDLSEEDSEPAPAAKQPPKKRPVLASKANSQVNAKVKGKAKPAQVEEDDEGLDLLDAEEGAEEDAGEDSGEEDLPF